MTDREQLEQIENVLKNEQLRIAYTVEGHKQLMQKGVCYCHAKAIVDAGLCNPTERIKQAQIDVLKRLKVFSEPYPNSWGIYVIDVYHIDELIKEVENDK